MPNPAPSPTPSATADGTSAPSRTEPATPPGTETPSPPRTGRAQFDPAAAERTIETLAGDIGPRMATGPAYRRAAAYVAKRFTDLGYAVRRQPVDVPSGDTWGAAVPAGTSDNVIAEPVGFDPEEPHVVVGAHLDSVPQAPGAEDNASGVATTLELARMATEGSPRLPVVFIAFGAEEPRGDGDAHHHYGSRHYVAALPPAQRSAIRAMVSLDRVGVNGGDVRVRTGGRASPAVAEAIRAVGERIGVPTSGGQDTASDHWSFEKAEVPAAKLGGHAFAGYHNEADRPRFVERGQLERTGRLAWGWLMTGLG